MSFENGLQWSLLMPGGLNVKTGHGAWSKTTKTGLGVFCDLHTFLA